MRDAGSHHGVIVGKVMTDHVVFGIGPKRGDLMPFELIGLIVDEKSLGRTAKGVAWE